MAAHTFAELEDHIGHQIACVAYGSDPFDPDGVAVECETCCEVLLDFDAPDPPGIGPHLIPSAWPIGQRPTRKATP